MLLALPAVWARMRLLLLVLLVALVALVPSAAPARWRRQTRVGEACVAADGTAGTCRSLFSCLVTTRFLDTRRGAAPTVRCAGKGTLCCGSGEASLVGNRPRLERLTAPPPEKERIALAPEPPVTPPPEQHGSLSLLPTALDCGIRGLAERIVGGAPADSNRFPWLAALEYSTGDDETAIGSDIGGETKLKCGGALISRRYVLTAAHCVTDLPGQYRLIAVRLGLHDVSAAGAGAGAGADGGQQFTAEQTLVHPDYHRPALHRNDVALLRLDRDAIEGDTVHPICLPLGLPRGRRWVGSKLTVAGFGLTQPDGRPSRRLRHVQLPVVALEECTRRLGGLARLGAGQMCAGGELGRDSCLGDSGGPLMAELPDERSPDRGLPDQVRQTYAVGLVSFGPRQCGSDTPGVYTRVADYLNWILDNIRP